MSVQGFVDAFVKRGSAAVDASKSMAKNTLVGAQQILQNFSDYISSDFEPTIRPVLDLSGVESGASSLNSMFSTGHALSIRGDISEVSGDASGRIAGFGGTYNFTQNNYSPKALSRLEIYRQTKNQFSTLERVTKS